eukprot:jgi/Undpi1/4756/HiC_scaffold_18.g08109.m1
MVLRAMAIRDINTAPVPHPPGTAAMFFSGLDTHLSTVATKLQAVSTSINAGLEKSMVEIMVSVPRVVTEVERVEASIKTLHAELSNLSGQLEEIDHGANAHVETLARLDLVKTHMGDCLHTLTEAASWNALVREVNARFGQEDLKGVAERLEAMVRSMAVLKDMPEAEDRAATLTGLQERLEDLLQPKLLEVLKKDRMGPLAEYALMYRQLGRTDVFRSDYCKTKAAAAHKRWFASASSSSPSPIAARGGGVATGGGTGDGLARWLPSFLEYLQGSMMDERKRTSDLFGTDNSPAVLCQLVVVAFQPLLGSFQKHLEAAPWRDAVGLLTEVLRFVGQALELARGASERDLMAVLLSATAAFRPIQDTFGVHERRHLSLELQPLLQTLAGIPAGAEEGDEAAAMAFTRKMEEVADVSTKGFVVVGEATGRCMELTAGYQARDLLKEVADALSAFLKAVRDAAQQSRRRSSGKHVSGEEGVSTEDVDAFSPGGDVEFDWQYLEGALVLLGAAGRCHHFFNTVEEGLASTLLRQRGALFAPSPPKFSSLVLPTNNSSGTALANPAANHANPSAFGEGRKGVAVGVGGVSPRGVSGAAGAESYSVTEEGRVAVLRSALARVRLEEDRTARAEVRASLMAIADPSSAMPGDVLPAPGRELRGLATDARCLVYDVCFVPITARLNTVPGLASWVEGEEEGGGGGRGWGGEGGAGDDAWEYDTVPQAYMTQVGEHLLSLLQNLEPFANSDAFQDAVEPTRDLHLLTETAWRECGTALDLHESELILLETLSGAKPPEDHSPYHDEDDDAAAEVDGGGVGGNEGRVGEREEGEAAAKFCTAWLLCVGSGTVGHLLAKMLSLPRLSERGVKHLEADLKYLSNVFHALDLAPPHALEHVSMLASLGKEEAASHLAQETSAGKC